MKLFQKPVAWILGGAVGAGAIGGAVVLHQRHERELQHERQLQNEQRVFETSIQNAMRNQADLIYWRDGLNTLTDENGILFTPPVDGAPPKIILNALGQKDGSFTLTAVSPGGDPHKPLFTLRDYHLPPSLVAK